MRIIITLILVLISNISYSQTIISGTVSDKSNGENIAYATVNISGTNIGVITNEYGFYSLSIDKKHFKNNKTTIIYRIVGYQKYSLVIDTTNKTNYNIKLTSTVTKIKGVKITANRNTHDEVIRSTKMSVIKVTAKSVKHIPTIGGEPDIIKIMKLLPGVTSGGEGGTSFFVRGGNADQNLVQLDEATVYNIGHLFGFFSVFNSDAVSDITMIKGGFGANYGGRLSSILDVRMKEGNLNKYHVTGGIGLLSSRLMVEGPIIKEKVSFLISGRRTYIDKVFNMVRLNLPYYFYDFNAKVNYKISEKDRLYYSFYLGRDILSISDEYIDQKDTTAQNNASGLNFGFTLGNYTNTLRWNHIYNSKLFSNISLIATNFDYNIYSTYDNNNLQINSKIFDLGIKADYDYFHNNDNHIKFGGSYIRHNFRPNIVNTSGDIESLLHTQEGEEMLTHEYGIYALNDWTINHKLKLNYGLRLSASSTEGKTYVGLEPRLAMRYILNKNNSIKASYSRMKQYMHKVSSSTVALPTDLWYPITKNIKPQSSDQIALGFNHYFAKQGVSFVFEVYYKKMNNLIEYREGTNLILNNDYESELLQGKGDAYGMEFLLRKESGRFNGWLSYTLSKTTRIFEELNNGNSFPSKYDRRHNISIVLNYQISERWLFSTVWVYQSGARFTAQIGQYLMPNPNMTSVDIIPLYSSRNAVEMAHSHRLDINFTLLPKKKRKFKGEFSFGAYNIYNRAQPYRINVVPNDNGTGYKYQQPGLFGFIPSIAYNFSF